MKVLLVASSGGHLTHLWWLSPWWSQHERVWCTFDTVDARTRLAGERVVHGYHPTNRSLKRLVQNLGVAWGLFMRERPHVLVSTGAGLAVPFFVVAALTATPSVFIEVYDRIETPSWTGRICRRLASRVVVQWPGQLEAYPDAFCLGPIR